jgi:hypothetical protein
MNIDRAHEIIVDTLIEYLNESNPTSWNSGLIQDQDIDNIADDLINKLFLYRDEDCKLMRDNVCMIPNCGKI